MEIIYGAMFTDGLDSYWPRLSGQCEATTDLYQEHSKQLSDISGRDRDNIHKTSSGLIEILFPHGEVSKKEIETVLRYAVVGRKRMEDQRMRIDSPIPRSVRLHG